MRERFVVHTRVSLPPAHAARRGFSLVEMLTALAVFGVFLVVLAGLQGEFLRYEGEVRVALFTHPAPLSVLARLRRDVLDSRFYPESEGSWIQSPDTLLLDTTSQSDDARVVVWDFSEDGIARRIEFEKGKRVAEWVARSVPRYTIGMWDAPGGRAGVSITAKDSEGNVIVDQVIAPRVR